MLARDGDELETHYRHVLESLGKQKGMLGVIFYKTQNKIQDPAKRTNSQTGGDGLFQAPQEEGGDAEHHLRGLRAAGAALG